MLATSWPEPFDDPRWLFEVKWDGFRCIAESGSDSLRLSSRRGLDLGGRFPHVAALQLPPGLVLDGEIVVFDDEGRADFSLLQAGRPASFVVFDVLASERGPLIGAPIEERLAVLAGLDLPSTVVRSEPIPTEGRALYGAAVERGLEGIVAKRFGSTYQPGRRSPDWRKVAARRRMRAVVGGWLPGEGGRRWSFGSLLVGLWDGEELRWVGAVGSGYSDVQLRPITAALHEIERQDPPFVNTGDIPSGARWVEPTIVVEIEFKEWTREERLRAPVFKGVAPSGTPARWDEEGPEGA